MSRYLALVAVGALLSMPRTAAAGVEQLALVGDHPSLERALETTLAAWRISLVIVADATPGSSMPSSGNSARAVAEAYRVGAVVWISRDVEQYALWLYDAESDRTVVRRLTTPPPFDDAAAAAVALSVKTLLRHSAVAPAQERYAASAPIADPTLRVEASAIAHVRSTEAGTFEPRLGLALSWWPKLLPQQRIGLAIGAEGGPGMTARSTAFAGRFTDTTLRIAGRASWDIGAGVKVMPELAAELHFTELDGAVFASGDSVRDRRVNPSFSAAAAFERQLAGNLLVGACTRASWVARRQRYLVVDATVFELPFYELQGLVFMSIVLR